MPLRALLWVLLAWAWAGPRAEADGVECRAEGPRLLVASSRNASGHWAVSLTLQQEARPRRPQRPAAILLDVHPMTSRCHGVRHDSLAVTLEGEPPVEPGYEQIEGFGFYKLHRKEIIWEKAKEVCEHEGAHLAILNSAAEADAILRFVKRNKVDDTNVFIGFHDKDEEGKHVTIFGEKMETMGFTRWNPGQPDNTANEDCGAINSNTGSLNDVSCTTLKSSYICEHMVI